MDEGLKRAVKQAGSVYMLAKWVGISQQAMSKWQRVPAHQIINVEAKTGVPREVLRPDLYRPRLQRPS